MTDPTDKAIADGIRWHATQLNALFKQAKERKINVSIRTSDNPYYLQAGSAPAISEYSVLHEMRFTKTESL